MQADIFCRRIDNYGDVGVCWRLARQLRDVGRWQVRLWIDDLAAFARIEPRCDAARPFQEIDGIEIACWSDPEPPAAPGEVVIEAFACDPPPAFRAAMRHKRPVWINLEYLSAQSWVESCHGLPSLQPDGLTKYFFFPGFTQATGGLLREAGLHAARDGMRHAPCAQRSFLAGLGVPPHILDTGETAGSPTAGCGNVSGPDNRRGCVGGSIAHSAGGPACASGRGDVAPGWRIVTLFCYPDAPLRALRETLEGSGTPTLLLVPQGVAQGLESGLAGGTAARLYIVRIPFLTQDDYDRLLWCADLNFVRGEDSLVRASWAGAPLVWQIYPQPQDAHLEKLQAWLARYGAPPAAQALIKRWNTSASPEAFATAWAAAMAPAAWAQWQDAARAWDQELSAHRELASTLVEFCTKMAAKC